MSCRINFVPPEATYMQKSVADVCLNCQRESCDGKECEAYQRAYCAAARNLGRMPIVYVVNGVAHTLYEWAEILGVKYQTLYSRIRSGMSPGDILYTGSLKGGRECGKNE